jgi:voltage-gated potassium channel
VSERFPDNPPPAGFEPFSNGAFRILHFVVQGIGLAAMAAITTATIDAPIRNWLIVALWCCLAFFAIEFALRLRARSDPRSPRNYPFSVSGLVDFFSVAAVPIALVAGAEPQSAWLFAALWPLKLGAFFPGFSLLGRVVRMEARPLASVLFIFLVVTLLSGVALHVLERAGQPQRFGNLPMSVWWAVTTLTTTGYGDSVPESFLGRVVAGIVMVCGLGVFGLLTGILTTGFTAEHRRRDFIRNWSLVTSVPFLRDLDPPAMIELTRLLRRLDVAEGTVIVRRGRPGDCMYFVASGEVEVRLTEPVRLGAGTFFGELALLDGGPRTATVVTTRTSTLLILDVSDFRAFTAMHPELAHAVQAEAAQRVGANKNVARTIS